MDRNLFTDQILLKVDIDSSVSHNASVLSDITTDTVMMPKNSAYETSEEASYV